MTDKPSVVEALSAVMAEVQAVGKGERNTQQGYNFRGIDAVVNAVGPALRKHGVIVVPVNVTTSYRDVQTSTGKPSRECTVSAVYRFYGPAGDFIEAAAPGESMDFGDKGAPKAMSVAYRILLLQALCIPTDDPDADSQSYERAYDHNRDATTRRGPQDTQQPDAWTTAPPEPQTDTAWVEAFKVRLTACGTPAEVDKADEEAHVAFADGKLTVDDARKLKTDIDARRAEIKGQPVGVGA